MPQWVTGPGRRCLLVEKLHLSVTFVLASSVAVAASRTDTEGRQVAAAQNDKEAGVSRAQGQRALTCALSSAEQTPYS